MPKKRTKFLFNDSSLSKITEKGGDLRKAILKRNFTSDILQDPNLKELDPSCSCSEYSRKKARVDDSDYWQQRVLSEKVEEGEKDKGIESLMCYESIDEGEGIEGFRRNEGVHKEKDKKSSYVIR